MAYWKEEEFLGLNYHNSLDKRIRALLRLSVYSWGNKVRAVFQNVQVYFRVENCMFILDEDLDFCVLSKVAISLSRTWGNF